MNLMFRKNFREGGGGGGGGGIKSGGGAKLNPKANRSQGNKRSRDMGYGNMDAADVHYRTHIFFAPSRGGGGADCEEPRCGPVTGAAISLPLAPCDVDAPQPLVDRRPSVSLLKWGSSKRNDAPTPTAARQVSFGTGSPFGVRSEPVSLDRLDRDCFIIPVHSLARFLPAGIPLPPPCEGVDSKPHTGPLSVLEVSESKLCVLAHLMSPLEPIDPVLETPLAHPLLKQRMVAAELLNEVQNANTAVGGMLLANMERTAEFPFIAYYVINTTKTDPTNFYSGIRSSSLSKFEPKKLRYTAAHTLDLYSEVAAIVRPPLVLSQNDISFRKVHSPSTAYIISIFKVFEGDDGERFEKNWLYWTGARMLYRYLPRSVGMRKIALHKSVSTKGDKMYLLVCECADLLKDISAAAVLIPALRARLCGYTGLYRPIQAF
ncbi:uncharacterized protein LOC119071492 isoform X1 [Bradysia coprophila]|uniref:uncharacterized protein LOC119071492 isoform X1 n=1 Tax=Bradysia coprophila TaxID=38358 RepID=UPI00187D75D6|nr:uncharacterized protein LOC119071492 isoform X1 [Bradysia coprophila]XP_037032239.1 uncharacterized protein LOC119071492 isoform X1 [Bradysia coprophila]XP_037032240.1 uncharacterized protein LOC119071492 isoform X1 [Bradysia coprophila]XP_037032241.1 uncharacterized protein LOC119071492 isoform X1 [Bradysia coprophila]